MATEPIILKEPVTGPYAWRGSDLACDTSWIIELSPAENECLVNALAQLKAAGLAFPHFRKKDFPLPELTNKLDALAQELETGTGFFLLRGLQIDGLNEDEINTVYYGLGLNIGLPVRQNPQGDLIGRVMNVGDINDKNTRVYETNLYLPYHTDPSDVFGLLCVRQGKSGGLSSIVSSAAVYNEILSKYPEYLGLYYRPLYYAHLGDETRSPIFSYFDGKLSCRYLRQYIELGYEQHGVSLSRVEIQALDLFDQIMHDEKIRLDMMLEPGDLLFANNYAVMHSRTGFEEFEDKKKRRKLLRLWLKMPNARTLAADFPGRNGFGAPDNTPL
jgi:hypothetical protein